MDKSVKLGVLAEDVICGFRGRVTGMVTYITGCNQALLAPRVKDDGSQVDPQWFDLDRLRVVDPKPIDIKSAAATGPDRPAPRR